MEYSSYTISIHTHIHHTYTHALIHIPLAAVITVDAICLIYSLSSVALASVQSNDCSLDTDEGCRPRRKSIWFLLALALLLDALYALNKHLSAQHIFIEEIIGTKIPRKISHTDHVLIKLK
ncbi:hypothetical protein EON65_48920 [archaeon]|nr:MAG: hypothetical protein EON65_48920 [archaeon]